MVTAAKLVQWARDPDIAFPALTLAAACLCLLWPSAARRASRLALRLVRLPAGRPVLWLTALATLTAAVHLLVVARYGYPVPRIHDEHSLLLAADTFASGRLANPPQPCPEYLEAPYVLQRPAYVSIYPPGQGLALAAGQRLAGHPWWSVLALSLLLPPVAFWAVRPWLPLHWAFWTSFLSFCLVFLNYWGLSYWGGALPVLGGALVLGAAGRLLRPDAPVAAALGLVLAAGVLILANTRLFEGLLYSLPLAVALALRARRLVRPLAVAALLLLAGAVWMGVYFQRTTGSPWRMPYQVFRSEAMARRYFIWEDHGPQIQHRNPRLARIYDGLYRRDLAGADYLRARLDTPQFYGPLWMTAAALLIAPWWRRRRWIVPGVAAAAVAAGVALEEYSHPHYAAPAAVALFLLFALLLRAAGRWRMRGVRFAPLLLVALAAAMLLRNEDAVARLLRGKLLDRAVLTARWRVAAHLQSLGGRHLVVVRYAPDHSIHDEWVFNAADPGSSPIVWAHDLGDAAPLRSCFPNRRLWRARVNGEDAVLESLE